MYMYVIVLLHATVSWWSLHTAEHTDYRHVILQQWTTEPYNALDSKA